MTFTITSVRLLHCKNIILCTIITLANRCRRSSVEQEEPQNTTDGVGVAIIKCINAQNCDCGFGPAMIRVKRCVLVVSYACHRVLLSVNCTSLNPSLMTLKQNQNQSPTMNQTRTLRKRKKKKRRHLMTWHPSAQTALQQKSAIRAFTVSSVSSLVPYSPPSLVPSPWLPRSDRQFRSYIR